MLDGLSSSFKSIRDIMVHIIGAEELWLSRWMGEQGRTLLNPDDFSTYTSLTDRWDNFRNQINPFLVSLTEEDLTQEISYKNLKENHILWNCGNRCYTFAIIHLSTGDKL